MDTLPPNLSNGWTHKLLEQAKRAANVEPGLYIIPTPIGNLNDITIRALQVIAACDTILCEDTRVTSRLLSRFALKIPLVAFHDHNELTMIESIISDLKGGATIGLVSDAGTPLIADPGYKLVAAAHKEQIPVQALPGPCALITALCKSGLPTHSFLFLGFYKEKILEPYLAVPHLTNPHHSSIIFYESPKRLSHTLQHMATQVPNWKIAVLRELTKIHEECILGSPTEVFDILNARPQIKGEIIVIVAPPKAINVEELDIDNLIKPLIGKHPLKVISQQLHDQYGINKKLIYQRCLELQ